MPEENIKAFDSNVLVYAFDLDEPEKRKIALMLFEEVNSYHYKGFISIQNLNELFYNLIRKDIRSLPEAAHIIQDLMRSKQWIVADLTKETLKLGLRLIKNKNQFWDGLIAANAVLNGVKEIYTENPKHFPAELIKPINPFK